MKNYYLRVGSTIRTYPTKKQAEEAYKKEIDFWFGGNRRNLGRIKPPEITLLTKKLFETGQITATKEILNKLSRDEMNAALLKHTRGDFGNAERDPNLAAIAANKGYVLSIYPTQHASDFGSEKFFVVTNLSELNDTIILYPEEY